MKDIYSPLEIDEEWDQRAPDMGGNEGGGTAVAVAPETTNVEPGSDLGASTLPPEQAVDTSADTSSVPMAGETIEPTGEMAHDPAHDVAEAAVGQSVPIAETNTEAPAIPDTLDINDMNSKTDEDSGAPTGEVATGVEEHTEVGVTAPESDEGTMPTEADSTEPTKINVMGDAELDEPDNKVEAGETFNPETFPGGKMPEPEIVEPEAKKIEEPELPASPVVEKEEKAIDEKPEPKAVEINEDDMDSTDKRLMAAIDRWKEKKAQEVKDLTELREKVETDIAKMNDEIADLQGRVSTKEGELDSIGQLLDEIGEVEEEQAA